MIKPIPCPFCGGTMVLYDDILSYKNKLDRDEWYRCKVCEKFVLYEIRNGKKKRYTNVN